MRNLRDCIEAGQLPDNLDLECSAVMIRSLMSGLLENWLLQPESFMIDAHTTTLVDTLLETLKNSVSTNQTNAKRIIGENHVIYFDHCEWRAIRK